MSGYYGQQSPKYVEVDENYTINSDTVLPRGVVETILDYIPTDVKSSLSFRKLLDVNRLPPTATTVGSVNIKASRELLTSEFTGPVSILILMTIDNSGLVSTTTVKIEATKIAGKFEGKYYIETVSTFNKGTPAVLIESNLIHYKYGVKHGLYQHNVTADGKTKIMDSWEYVNGYMNENDKYKYFLTRGIDTIYALSDMRLRNSRESIEEIREALRNASDRRTYKVSN